MENEKSINISGRGGDVIGVGIDGNGNIIGKNMNVFINEVYDECGLTLLHPNHFKDNSYTDENFNSWLKGFPLSLESIYYKREFRRESLISKIKNKLEEKNRLLILGNPGTSKTILLMEIICDYFDRNYKILYNLGEDELKNTNRIVEKIKGLVYADNEVLVVADNVHNEKMSLIFNVVQQFQALNPEKRGKIKFLLSARIPEYYWVLEKNLFNDPKLTQTIKSLFGDEFKFEIPNFTQDEVKGFIEKYKNYLHSSRRKRSVEENAEMIYKDTYGYPIMVKFAAFQDGLQTHVEEMYQTYLLDIRNNNELYSKRIQTVIACSLFDISSIPLSNQIMKNLQLQKYALDLDNTIIRKFDNMWKTIHPRWDLELLKYIFSLSERTIEDIKEVFSDLVGSIIKEKDISNEEKLAILHDIYYVIAGNKYVQPEIIEEIVNYKNIKNSLDQESSL